MYPAQKSILAIRRSETAAQAKASATMAIHGTAILVESHSNYSMGNNPGKSIPTVKDFSFEKMRKRNGQDSSQPLPPAFPLTLSHSKISTIDEDSKSVANTNHDPLPLSTRAMPPRTPAVPRDKYATQGQ